MTTFKKLSSRLLSVGVLLLVSCVVWGNWTLECVSGSIINGKFYENIYMDGFSDQGAMRIYVSTDSENLNSLSLSFEYPESGNISNAVMEWGEDVPPGSGDGEASFYEDYDRIDIVLSMPSRGDVFIPAGTSRKLVGTVYYDILFPESDLNFPTPIVNAAYTTKNQPYKSSVNVTGPSDVEVISGFNFRTLQGSGYGIKSYSSLTIDPTDDSHFECVSWNGSALVPSDEVKFVDASTSASGILTIRDGKIIYEPSGFFGEAIISYRAASTNPDITSEIEGEVTVTVAENIPEWQIDLVAGSIVNGEFFPGQYLKNISTYVATQVYVTTDDNALNSLSLGFKLPSNLTCDHVEWGEGLPPTSGNADWDVEADRSLSILGSMSSRSMPFIPANSTRKLLATIFYNPASQEGELALTNLPTVHAAYSTQNQNCKNFFAFGNQKDMSVGEGFYFGTKQNFTMPVSSFLATQANDASHFDCKIWDGKQLAPSGDVKFSAASADWGGVVTLLDNGTLFFVPSDSFAGVETVSYEVTAKVLGHDATLRGTFDVTVQAPSSPASAITVDAEGNFTVDTQEDFPIEYGTPLPYIPGQIAIHSDKSLIIDTELHSGKDVNLQACQDVVSWGDIETEGNVRISAGNDVNLCGDVFSEGCVEIESYGSICVSSDIDAWDGDVSLSAEKDIESWGHITSANGVTLKARGNIAVQGDVEAWNDISIASYEGNVGTMGNLRAGVDIVIDAAGDVKCMGDIEAGYDVVICSSHDIELTGKVRLDDPDGHVDIYAYGDLLIGNGCFTGFKGNLNIRAGRQITIGEGAFENAKIGDLDFTHNYLSIERNAFKGCSGLRSIGLSFFTRLYDSAFAGCVDLEKVYLPSDQVLASFPDNAFEGCKSNLTFYVNSTGPEGTTWNGYAVFYVKGKGTTEALQENVSKISEDLSGLQQKCESIAPMQEAVNQYSIEIETLKSANTQKDATIAELTQRVEVLEQELTSLLEVLRSGEPKQVLTATSGGNFDWVELPTDFTYATNDSFRLKPGWNMLSMPELEMTKESIDEFLKHGFFYHYNEVNKTYEKLKDNRLAPRESYWFYLNDNFDCTIHFRTLEK